jgi:hypothetical protein
MSQLLFQIRGVRLNSVVGSTADRARLLQLSLRGIFAVAHGTLQQRYRVLSLSNLLLFLVQILLTPGALLYKVREGELL